MLREAILMRSTDQPKIQGHWDQGHILGGFGPPSMRAPKKKKKERGKKEREKEGTQGKKNNNNKNMTNRAPFKHKQGRPRGVPGKKVQGRQIDGGVCVCVCGEGVRVPFFNFAPGGEN